MRVLLEINDNMATPLMQVLNSLPYVKTKPLTDDNAKIMANIKDAVKELTLIRQGKLKGISSKQLLDEL